MAKSRNSRNRNNGSNSNPSTCAFYECNTYDAISKKIPSFKVYDAKSCFNLDLYDLSKEASNIVKTLYKAQHDSYYVGGVIRDLLIGSPFNDIDICTTATPQKIKEIFQRRCKVIGRRFILCHVASSNQKFDVATFRVDSPQNDSQQESQGILAVDNNYSFSILEDAIRRDFTINALYGNVVKNQILDFFNGVEDLLNHRLVMIGDPNIRLRQDPMRIMRAIRQSAKMNFVIEPTLRQAIFRYKELLRLTSESRFSDELNKTFSCGAALRVLELFAEYDIFNIALPQFTAIMEAEITATDRFAYVPEFKPKFKNLIDQYANLWKDKLVAQGVNLNIFKDHSRSLALTLAGAIISDARVSESQPVNPAFILTTMRAIGFIETYLTFKNNRLEKVSRIYKSSDNLTNSILTALAEQTFSNDSTILNGRDRSNAQTILINLAYMLSIFPNDSDRRYMSKPMFRAAFSVLKIYSQLFDLPKDIAQTIAAWEKLHDRFVEERAQSDAMVKGKRPSRNIKFTDDELYTVVAPVLVNIEHALCLHSELDQQNRQLKALNLFEQLRQDHFNTNPPPVSHPKKNLTLVVANNSSLNQALAGFGEQINSLELQLQEQNQFQLVAPSTSACYLSSAPTTYSSTNYSSFSAITELSPQLQQLLSEFRLSQQYSLHHSQLPLNYQSYMGDLTVSKSQSDSENLAPAKAKKSAKDSIKLKTKALDQDQLKSNHPAATLKSEQFIVDTIKFILDSNKFHPDFKRSLNRNYFMYLNQDSNPYFGYRHNLSLDKVVEFMGKSFYPSTGPLGVSYTASPLTMLLTGSFEQNISVFSGLTSNHDLTIDPSLLLTLSKKHKKDFEQYQDKTLPQTSSQLEQLKHTIQNLGLQFNLQTELNSPNQNQEYHQQLDLLLTKVNTLVTDISGFNKGLVDTNCSNSSNNSNSSNKNNSSNNNNISKTTKTNKTSNSKELEGVLMSTTNLNAQAFQTQLYPILKPLTKIKTLVSKKNFSYLALDIKTTKDPILQNLDKNASATKSKTHNDSKSSLGRLSSPELQQHIATYFNHYDKYLNQIQERNQHNALIAQQLLTDPANPAKTVDKTLVTYQQAVDFLEQPCLDGTVCNSYVRFNQCLASELAQTYLEYICSLHNSSADANDYSASSTHQSPTSSNGDRNKIKLDSNLENSRIQTSQTDISASVLAHDSSITANPVLASIQSLITQKSELLTQQLINDAIFTLDQTGFNNFTQIIRSQTNYQHTFIPLVDLVNTNLSNQQTTKLAQSISKNLYNHSYNHLDLNLVKSKTVSDQSIPLQDNKDYYCDTKPAFINFTNIYQVNYPLVSHLYQFNIQQNYRYNNECAANNIISYTKLAPFLYQNASLNHKLFQLSSLQDIVNSSRLWLSQTLALNFNLHFNESVPKVESIKPKVTTSPNTQPVQTLVPTPGATLSHGLNQANLSETLSNNLYGSHYPAFTSSSNNASKNATDPKLNKTSTTPVETNNSVDELYIARNFTINYGTNDSEQNLSPTHIKAERQFFMRVLPHMHLDLASQVDPITTVKGFSYYLKQLQTYKASTDSVSQSKTSATTDTLDNANANASSTYTSSYELTHNPNYSFKQSFNHAQVDLADNNPIYFSACVLAPDYLNQSLCLVNRYRARNAQEQLDFLDNLPHLAKTLALLRSVQTSVSTNHNLDHNPSSSFNLSSLESQDLAQTHGYYVIAGLYSKPIAPWANYQKSILRRYHSPNNYLTDIAYYQDLHTAYDNSGNIYTQHPYLQADFLDTNFKLAQRKYFCNQKQQLTAQNESPAHAQASTSAKLKTNQSGQSAKHDINLTNAYQTKFEQIVESYFSQNLEKSELNCLLNYNRYNCANTFNIASSFMQKSPLFNCREQTYPCFVNNFDFNYQDSSVDFNLMFDADFGEQSLQNREQAQQLEFHYSQIELILSWLDCQPKDYLSLIPNNLRLIPAEHHAIFNGLLEYSAHNYPKLKPKTVTIKRKAGLDIDNNVTTPHDLGTTSNSPVNSESSATDRTDSLNASSQLQQVIDHEKKQAQNYLQSTVEYQYTVYPEFVLAEGKRLLRLRERFIAFRDRLLAHLTLLDEQYTHGLRYNQLANLIRNELPYAIQAQLCFSIHTVLCFPQTKIKHGKLQIIDYLVDSILQNCLDGKILKSSYANLHDFKKYQNRNEQATFKEMSRLDWIELKVLDSFEPHTFAAIDGIFTQMNELAVIKYYYANASRLSNAFDKVEQKQAIYKDPTRYQRLSLLTRYYLTSNKAHHSTEYLQQLIKLNHTSVKLLTKIQQVNTNINLMVQITQILNLYHQNFTTIRDAYEILSDFSTSSIASVETVSDHTLVQTLQNVTKSNKTLITLAQELQPLVLQLNSEDKFSGYENLDLNLHYGNHVTTDPITPQVKEQLINNIHKLLSFNSLVNNLCSFISNSSEQSLQTHKDSDKIASSNHNFRFLEVILEKLSTYTSFSLNFSKKIIDIMSNLFTYKHSLLSANYHNQTNRFIVELLAHEQQQFDTIERLKLEVAKLNDYYNDLTKYNQLQKLVETKLENGEEIFSEERQAYVNYRKRLDEYKPFIELSKILDPKANLAFLQAQDQELVQEVEAFAATQNTSRRAIDKSNQLIYNHSNFMYTHNILEFLYKNISLFSAEQALPYFLTLNQQVTQHTIDSIFYHQINFQQVIPDFAVFDRVYQVVFKQLLPYWQQLSLYLNFNHSYLHKCFNFNPTTETLVFKTMTSGLLYGINRKLILDHLSLKNPYFKLDSIYFNGGSTMESGNESFTPITTIPNQNLLLNVYHNRKLQANYFAPTTLVNGKNDYSELASLLKQPANASSIIDNIASLYEPLNYSHLELMRHTKRSAEQLDLYRSLHPEYKEQNEKFDEQLAHDFPRFETISHHLDQIIQSEVLHDNNIVQPASKGKGRSLSINLNYTVKPNAEPSATITTNSFKTKEHYNSTPNSKDTTSSKPNLESAPKPSINSTPNLTNTTNMQNNGATSTNNASSKLNPTEVNQSTAVPTCTKTEKSLAKIIYSSVVNNLQQHFFSRSLTQYHNELSHLLDQAPLHKNNELTKHAHYNINNEHEGDQIALKLSTYLFHNINSGTNQNIIPSNEQLDKLAREHMHNMMLDANNVHTAITTTDLNQATSNTDTNLNLSTQNAPTQPRTKIKLNLVHKVDKNLDKLDKTELNLATPFIFSYPTTNFKPNLEFKINPNQNLQALDVNSTDTIHQALEYLVDQFNENVSLENDSNRACARALDLNNLDLANLTAKELDPNDPILSSSKVIDANTSTSHLNLATPANSIVSKPDNASPITLDLTPQPAPNLEDSEVTRRKFKATGLIKNRTPHTLPKGIIPPELPESSEHNITQARQLLAHSKNILNGVNSKRKSSISKIIACEQDIKNLSYNIDKYLKLINVCEEAQTSKVILFIKDTDREFFDLCIKKLVVQVQVLKAEQDLVHEKLFRINQDLEFEKVREHESKIYFDLAQAVINNDAALYSQTVPKVYEIAKNKENVRQKQLERSLTFSSVCNYANKLATQQKQRDGFLEVSDAKRFAILEVEVSPLLLDFFNYLTDKTINN